MSRAHYSTLLYSTLLYSFPTLRANVMGICGLNTPGVLISHVNSGRIQDCLPLEVQYASLYWILHLQKSCTQLHDHG